MKKYRYLLLYSCILALLIINFSKYYSNKWIFKASYLFHTVDPSYATMMKEYRESKLERMYVYFERELTEKEVKSFTRKYKKYEFELISVVYKYQKKTYIHVYFNPEKIDGETVLDLVLKHRLVESANLDKDEIRI